MNVVRRFGGKNMIAKLLQIAVIVVLALIATGCPSSHP
jgi:hypothetical protein